MTEQVGSITLDLSEYSGKDLYSEGAGEDLLLELVKNNKQEDYNRIIAENAGWSNLYHLSEIRGNIIDFLPISDRDKVLEVGAGCGAITQKLATMAGSLTCVELSKKRSLINAYRNSNLEHGFEIKVGNFQDVEKKLDTDYDYIMLIGVFEYAASYIQAADPYKEFLNILLGHLKEGGRLIIAIENKYGIKYWAGSREDHLGTFYSGIEGYREADHVRTFSRNKLKKLLKGAGLRVEEYFPYPDYKLPTTIFSLDRLPVKGELTGVAPNFDNDRIVAFDEGLVLDELIDEDRFEDYSNSFLFVAQKGERVESFQTRKVIFSKHSNDRDPKYAIRTDIEIDGYGKKYVVKRPMTNAAKRHIDSMSENFTILCEQYKDSIFVPNSYKMIESGAEFEYIEGVSLSERILKLLSDGNTAEAKKLIDTFVSQIKMLPDAPKTNMDLIFSNILLDNSDNWTVIDYEWMFEGDYSKEFVIYRALRYFIEDVKNAGLLEVLIRTVSDNNHNKIGCAIDAEVYKAYGISGAKLREYEDKEIGLQQEIAGGHISLLGFYSIFGKDAFPLEVLKNRGALLPRIDRVKIYFDEGQGFGEDNTCYLSGEIINMEETGDVIRVNIPVSKETKAIRLDPSDEPCMVRLISIPVTEVLVNGTDLGSNMVYYGEMDPQIIMNGIDKVTATSSSTDDFVTVTVEYRISAVDKEFAGAIGTALKDSASGGVLANTPLNRRRGPYEKIRLS